MFFFLTQCVFLYMEYYARTAGSADDMMFFSSSCYNLRSKFNCRWRSAHFLYFECFWKSIIFNAVLIKLEIKLTICLLVIIHLEIFGGNIRPPVLFYYVF